MSAELFETRVLLDASTPLIEPAIVEVTEVRTTDEFIEDPSIFYTLGTTAIAPPVTQFESREQFGEFLIERALERYSGSFDQPVWHYRGPIYALADGNFRASSMAPLVDREFSETNTQVAGVDEADIIETDGNFLYLLNGQDLVIAQTPVGGDVTQVARVRLEGVPVAEYLDGDRLTVISSKYSYVNDGISYFRGFVQSGSSQTIVSTFDISDRSNPTLVKEATLDGNYIDSRAIDGQVHLITTNDINLPAPEISGKTTKEVPIYYYGGMPIDVPAITLDRVSFDAAPDVSIPLVVEETQPVTETIEVDKYESQDSYVTRIREQLDRLIDELLPHYSIVTAGGLAAVGHISEIDAISQIADANSDSLLSVVSIDTRDAQPGLSSSSSVLATYTNGIYANQNHLYVFSPIWGAERAQTRILEFAWANGEREIELLATGVIDGTLHNQFSADEFEGKLRVATTTTNYGENGFFQANNLVVLENVAGTLTQVGAVENFAEGERIYSVRFNDDQAFVVTFRQTDPLFVFDLTDATQPAITGELHVPGYSSYLQLIDDDHLLAIGRSTTDFATKVALYDVSDPAHPTEVDEDILPSWTWSIAEWDHKAISYFGTRNTLAIPVSSYDFETYTNRNELFVFNVDVTLRGEDALQLRGQVTDDSYIVRSAFVDDVLYTISGNSVISTDFDDPRILRDQLDLTDDSEVVTISIKPIFTETDDGASDWDYTNAPTSEEEADDLLALGAKNLLNGQVRITLLQSDGRIHISLKDGNVVAASDGHDTETIPLATAQSLVIDGTDAADRMELNFGTPGENSLTEIVVSGKLGHDRVDVTSVASALNGRVIINGDDGNDTITVNPQLTTGVRISGGLGRDMLKGGAGRDWIHGGSGSDFIDGGEGSDVLYGGGSSDQIYGSGGNDLMSGGSGNDFLNGGAGNDTADGNAGNDGLRGGLGNDLLKGGDDDDVLRGESGNDTLLGGAGNDRLEGGTGNDALVGGTGNDLLMGDAGNDSLLGGAGNDVLRGGLGRDVALGEDDDDDVFGGDETDTVSGGAGEDRLTDRINEVDESFVLSAKWINLV